ncbi:MAG: helix-turn-helix transcriptional regulator [Chloroflexi bacterium]|nr:helix-turn-helix transcriptional regulator [Chloroflexota bacterium]
MLTSPVEPVSTVSIRLSAREQQVLVYFMCGLTVKNTAQQLGVTQWTVKTHQRNLYRKLQVSDRMSAILWGWRQEGFRRAVETTVESISLSLKQTED